MTRALLCLGAEGVVRDAVTNNVSIFNILEGLTAEGFPVLLQRVAFFVLWERTLEDPSHLTGRFAVDISGRELYTSAVDIDFQDKLRLRSIIAIGGLVIPQPGALTFSLSLDDGATASYTIQVNAVVTATQQPEPGQPPA